MHMIKCALQLLILGKKEKMHILINMQYLFGYNISEAIFTQIFSEVTI